MWIMSITPIELWLLFGIILIILEFSQLPGIGFLFLGLGAISTAIITSYWPQGALLYQFAYFAITALLWFLLLYYPLKLFIYKNSTNLSRESFDIIGSRVIVSHKDIKPGEYGQVLWSGTIMNAKLTDNAIDIATIGETIYVLEVKGNVLICSKKES
jgi:membrane protein implicated in regulation of membrane protease activity